LGAALALLSGCDTTSAPSKPPPLLSFAKVSAVKNGMSAAAARHELGEPWGQKDMIDDAQAWYFDGEDAEGVDRVIEVILSNEKVIAVSTLK
jgi:hypothetical protein